MKSAVLLLAHKVTEWFTIPEIAAYYASISFVPPFVGTTGWKQREQQLNVSPQGANRMLFIPGTLAGGDEGALENPRRTAGNPRSLARWARVLTVSLWSVDKTDPQNEELQIEASDNLLEAAMQALVHVAHDDVIFSKVSRDPAASKNLPFGREVLLEFVHREHLLDFTRPVVQGATPSIERVPST
jgi:hypothetical protein